MGIVFDDMTIALYSSCEDVKNLLGEPYSTWDDSLYYFNNELRFDFDDDGKVEFIEFLGGIDGELQPIIYDVPARAKQISCIIYLGKKTVEILMIAKMNIRMDF